LIYIIVTYFKNPQKTLEIDNNLSAEEAELAKKLYKSTKNQKYQRT